MLHGNAMIGVRQAIDGIWMDGKGVHYADSFTEDGIMQAGPRNVETPLVGQENLIRMAARPAPSRFRHIVPNVQVHPTPGDGREPPGHEGYAREDPERLAHQAAHEQHDLNQYAVRLGRRFGTLFARAMPPSGPSFVSSFSEWRRRGSSRSRNPPREGERCGPVALRISLPDSHVWPACSGLPIDRSAPSHRHEP